jgi:hypothetical protein
MPNSERNVRKSERPEQNITGTSTVIFRKKSTEKGPNRYTPDGYLGRINGRYILFATENEYYEYLEEENL